MKRLIESEPIDIIMLQETLCSADQITRAMQALVPGWIFFANDAVGRSGGLAIGINPRSIKVDSTWGGAGFIGLGHLLG
jgi:exonuclease III